MKPEIEAKARRIHRHALRFRNFILRRLNPEEIWKAEGFEPTFPQIRAMMILHMSNTSTLKNLANALNISHPSASQMVDRLVESGMVSRDQDPDDRRRVVIRLTEKAELCMASHENAILNQIGNLMEQMEPGYVDEWVHVASYLDELLMQYPDLGIPEMEDPETN